MIGASSVWRCCGAGSIERELRWKRVHLGRTPMRRVYWGGSPGMPWMIESSHPRHTGVAVIDLNQDGRLDIVAAINRSWDVETEDSGPSMEVFFNEGPR